MPIIRHWENLHCTVYFPYITCLLPLYVYVLVQMLLKKHTKKRYRRNIARHTKKNMHAMQIKKRVQQVSLHIPSNSWSQATQDCSACNLSSPVPLPQKCGLPTCCMPKRTASCIGARLRAIRMLQKTGPKTVQRTRTAGNSSLLLRTSLVLWQIVHGIVSGCGWALENINTTRTGQDKTETQSKSNQMTKIILHSHT